MARHDDVYKGIRFIVDTISAGDGRFGYQAVVDGKRPIIGPPCASEREAMAAGIAAAQAKIESVLQAYRAPR
jgi:hypothetical protein